GDFANKKLGNTWMSGGSPYSLTSTKTGTLYKLNVAAAPPAPGGGAAAIGGGGFCGGRRGLGGGGGGGAAPRGSPATRVAPGRRLALALPAAPPTPSRGPLLGLAPPGGPPRGLTRVRPPPPPTTRPPNPDRPPPPQETTPNPLSGTPPQTNRKKGGGDNPADA